VNLIKKLASETAIYGLPSIIGRFLSFLLIFLYTDKFSPGIFAAHTEFYAYSAFFLVILPLGLETAFFNFLRLGENQRKTFSTSWFMNLLSASFFLTVIFYFSSNIAAFLGYPNHKEYVHWFALILFFDVLSMIPFAALRWQKKSKKFALIRMVNIVFNIFLNVLFIVYFPKWFGEKPHWLYHPEIGIGYVFIANLISSFITFILLVPSIFSNGFNFDFSLGKKMLRYAAPLILVGLAGIVNETFDRVIMDKILISENVKHDIGTYGAFYKLSIIITLFLQAFRYAAEPFFFERSTQKDPQKTYAEIMNYFVLVCVTIVLITLFFLEPIAKFAIRQEAYFLHPDGLKMVPILLVANVFLGVLYNLSIWYKLQNKNHLGAIVSVNGAIITIVLLFILIPRLGIIGGAYTTLIVYFIMMIHSYVLGQKHYPVPYELLKLFVLVVFGIIFFLSNIILKNTFLTEKLVVFNVIKLVLILLFMAIGWVVVNSKKKRIFAN
jgi:O-antigen/teichoic acid export membrane protein